MGIDGTEQNYMTRTIPKTDGTILRLNNYIIQDVKTCRNIDTHWDPIFEPPILMSPGTFGTLVPGIS
jgi:hypothetical protein